MAKLVASEDVPCPAPTRANIMRPCDVIRCGNAWYEITGIYLGGIGYINTVGLRSLVDKPFTEMICPMDIVIAAADRGDYFRPFAVDKFGNISDLYETDLTR